MGSHKIAYASCIVVTNMYFIHTYNGHETVTSSNVYDKNGAYIFMVEMINNLPKLNN